MALAGLGAGSYARAEVIELARTFIRGLRRVAGPLAVGGFIGLRWKAGRGWGVEEADRHRTLPGDDVIGRPDAVLTHAVEIDAPPVEVWPWIVQMGADRAGWYTPRWIDEYLWRVDTVSIDHIDAELQTLEVGQRILDGPVGTAVFDVRDVQENRALVLHSQRHPVTGIPPDLDAPDPGPYFDFSWTFVLEEAPDQHTKLLIRTRSVVQLPQLSRLLAWVVGPVLDFVMARWMLLGIKRRVEGKAAEVSVQ